MTREAVVWPVLHTADDTAIIAAMTAQSCKSGRSYSYMAFRKPRKTQTTPHATHHFSAPLSRIRLFKPY